MDLITQGLLGGVLAQSVARKEEKKHATIIGMFAGVLADADILIASSSDPLLNIEFHRHFTHSLFFIPFGAALAFLLLWPFMRHRLSNARLYLFCFVGYSMSGVIDACTSYGTHLLWPLSDERIAWHLISIVDPIFTMALLFTLVMGLRKPARAWAGYGLLFAVGYMSLGYMQLQRAMDISTQLAQSRGHQPIKHVVKPTLGNLLLWRSTYINERYIYVDAVRLGIVDDSRIYQGSSVPRLDIEKDLPDLDASKTLFQDIKRFNKFSDGFIAYDPTQVNVIGDMRYSMLPTGIAPLWGIVIDKQNPDQHADYQFFRENNHQNRQQFINMLLGDDPGRVKNGS
ncbi:MAG: metal-dependent hydrolase [Gammaproteobacteria bacterium]|nr:metal-dependent hydrolase [Gammaproteobacteria bacterium]